MSSPRILAVGSAIALILAGAIAAAQTSGGVPTYSFEPVDPVCQSRTLTSTGGGFPKNPHTLVLRWASFANYELVYNGQVILLDAYFDRGYGYAATGPAGGFLPLGFKAADVKKVDAIFLGHGHYDHMSDAASIGARTGAMVVGGPPSAEKLYTQAIDRKQVKSVTGRGGEVLNFKGFTVEPILGRHSDNPAKITKTLEDALKSVALSKPMTAAEAAEQKEVLSRGTSDPRVMTEGTISYLFTFDGGFRLIYKDSSGDITDIERAAMARIGGRVDVAIVALAAALIQPLTIGQALQAAQTYKPRYLLPAHHDMSIDGLWRATEPVFQAIKDDNPSIITISKGFREPTCFDTDRPSR